MKKIFLLAAFISQALLANGNCKISFAMKGESTLITSDLLELASCDRAQLDNLSECNFPKNGAGKIEEGIEAPVHFLLGVCSFHKEAANSSVEAQEKVIDHLQKSTLQALMLPQREVASFYEGLTHCRVSRLLLNEMNEQSDGRTSNRRKKLFCMHRSMAKESFGDIDWTKMQLSYQSNKREYSLKKRVEEMSSCAAEILQSSNDSFCGEITPLAPGDIEKIAAEASQEILGFYVGPVSKEQAYETGVPPYTAMIARKLAMTEGTLAKSSESFEILARKNDHLQSNFEQLLSVYGSISAEDILTAGGTHSYPGRVGALSFTYKDAISKAMSLLELADRWEKGLYSENGRDLRVELQKNLVQLQEQSAYLKGKPNQEGDKGLIGLVDSVSKSITSLAESKVTGNRNVTRSMCALYYCDIRARDPKGFTEVCNIEHRGQFAGKPVYTYDINPLCDHPRRPASNGVSELCRAAGFPVELQNIKDDQDEGLRRKINACMETHFDKKLLDTYIQGLAT